MAAILEISHLKKVYSTGNGVFDVSMEVEAGTLHGFLGVNGSGKTTTMKCIMSLLKKDGGSIRAFGNEVRYDDPVTKMRFGFSPELPAYPPYLTGQEVLVSYCRMKGFSKNACTMEAKDILESVGLQDAMKNKISKYSRGMVARIGVGVAMLGNPELMILDEPTSGLDPVAAESLRKLLKKITDDGGAVLLSSHQLHDVQKICSMLTVINKGRTIVEGETKDLLNMPGASRSVTAEFNALNDKILADINAIEFVKEVTLAEEGQNTVNISISEQKDIRAELAQVAIKNNALLLTCNSDNTDLERVFLSLVNGNEHETT